VNLQKESNHGNDEKDACSSGHGTRGFWCDNGRSTSDGVSDGDDHSSSSGIVVLEDTIHLVFVFVDFLDLLLFTSREFNVIIFSVLSTVIIARNFVVSLVAVTSGVLGDVNGFDKVGAVGDVDLEGKSNSSDNDFTDNDSSSLVQGVGGGKDISIDLSVDVDGSARSQDVVGGSSRERRKMVSVEVDISISADVDDPFGSKGAFGAGFVPGDGIEDGGIEVEDVFRVVTGTVNEETEILHVEVNVGGLGSQSSSNARVALESSGEISLEVVGEDGESSELQEIRGSEISTDEDSFNISLVGSRGRDIGEDSARAKDGITSDDEGVRNKVILSSGRVDFSTNRISAAEVQVSGSDQSSFNITSGGIEVSKGDDVEVSEGVKSVSESKRQSALGFNFEEGARLGKRRRGIGLGRSRASRHVDLRSSSLGIVGSSNYQSFNHTSVLDEVVARSNDVSDQQAVDVEFVHLHGCCRRC